MYARNLTFEGIVLKFLQPNKSELLPVNKVKELDKMTGKKRKANKISYDDEDKENDMTEAKIPKQEELTPAPLARESMIVTDNQNSSGLAVIISKDNLSSEEEADSNNLLEYAYHTETTPIKTSELVDEIDIDVNDETIIENAENTIEKTLVDSKIDIDNSAVIDEIITEKNAIGDMIEDTAKQSKIKPKKKVSFGKIETRSKTKASETVENLTYSSSSSTSIPDNIENPMHSSSSSNKDVEDVPTSKAMVLRERLVFFI